MKRLAIFSVLSKKLKDGNLKILSDFGSGISKTKEMAGFLKNIVDLRTKHLLIPASSNKNPQKAVVNIKNIGAISSHSLNIYDLLRYKNVILEKEAVEEIEKHYL